MGSGGNLLTQGDISPAPRGTHEGRGGLSESRKSEGPSKQALPTCDGAAFSKKRKMGGTWGGEGERYLSVRGGIFAARGDTRERQALY